MNNIKKAMLLATLCLFGKNYSAESVPERKAIKVAMKITKIQQKISRNELIRKFILGGWGFWGLQFIKAGIYRNDPSNFLGEFAGAYAVFTYLVIKYLSEEDAFLNEKCKVLLKDIPAEMLIDNTVA